MFKFLHAADIHLDSPLHRLDLYEGAPVEELRQATRRALENMVDLALTEAVSFVLIAGDLYDGDWKDYNTGLHFISRMSRLREAGISVFIIAGNHDAASKITRILRLPEGVVFLESETPRTVTLDKDGVAIHGQSFASPAVRKNLASKYPMPLPGYFNIGMLHTCATGREGHEPYAPCTLEDLRSKGYDYWALGHVHKREFLLEDPPVAFPGNLQGRHIREEGPKGCMLVSVDDHGRATAEFRSLDVIRWVRVRADAPEAASVYDAVELIGDRLEQVLEENEGMPIIARVELAGTCPAHDALASDLERWTNEIRSAATDVSHGRIWVEKVKLLTRLPGTEQDGGVSTGPIGELVQYIEGVRQDPDQLKILAESLQDLVRKLPGELREGPDALAPEDPRWLANRLEQIRPMLLNRLTGKEHSQ
jgi:DNA repair exonuclease SbcCD nuclease subunit